MYSALWQALSLYADINLRKNNGSASGLYQKFSVLIDESSVSNKTCLIIYIRIPYDKESKKKVMVTHWTDKEPLQPY